jgi:hypothetical protein
MAFLGPGEGVRAWGWPPRAQDVRSCTLREGMRAFSDKIEEGRRLRADGPPLSMPARSSHDLRVRLRIPWHEDHARLSASLSTDWCMPAKEKTNIWPTGQSYSVIVSSVMSPLALNATTVRISFGKSGGIPS